MAYFGDNAIHAWADIDGTGTAHLDNSYNCTGVTDHGIGNYTLNFSTNAATADYCVLGSNIGESNDNHTHSWVCSVMTAPTSSGCRFGVEHKSAGSRDHNKISICVISTF